MAALDRVAEAAELSRPSAVLMNFTAGGVSLIEDATARGTAGARAFLLHTSGVGEDLLTYSLVTTFVALWVSLLVLCFCPQLLWLVFYPKRVTNRRPPFPEEVPELLSMEDESKQFYHGLFSCIGISDTCLFALCCMPCRHADTLKAAGFTLGFYPTILIFVLLDVGSLILGSIIVAVSMGKQENMTDLEKEEAAMLGQQLDALIHATVLTLIFVPYRGSIRKKFGSPASWGVRDIFSWFCCAPCVIAQEGMQIDNAQNVHVACPCSLYVYNGGQKVLVGEPEGVEAEAEAEG